jgi:hypothetical protein
MNGSKPCARAIVCSLDALTPAERGREATLLEEHRTSFRERHEHEDGFSFRYPSDAALFVRIAELVSLEHKCCPFLDFRLEWNGGAETPCLHVTGGSHVKDFVATTFGRSI